MSKFLTPPNWYDQNGSEINIFNNTTYIATGPDNTAIGTSAIAGRPSSEGISYGAVAVGSQAQAKGGLSIAIGSYNDDNFQTAQTLAYGSIAIGAGAKANADSTDGIAIGSRTTSGQGGVAIGAGASATGNQIQLGGNNTAYTLQVGNGTGTLGIGSIKFQKMTINSNKVSLSSQGVYLCCTTKNSVSGIVICFIGDLSCNATVLESSTNLCTYVASDIGTGSQVHQIQASSGVTINYCFKIINI